MSATSAYIIILVIIIVIVVGITSIITKVIIARLLFHVRSSPLILPGRRRSGYVTARAAQAVLETWAGARNPAIPIVMNNENNISSNNNNNRHAANKSAATRGRRPRLACYLGFFVPYRLPNGACMPRAGSQRYRGTFGACERHREFLVSSGSWRQTNIIFIVIIIIMLLLS